MRLVLAELRSAGEWPTFSAIDRSIYRATDSDTLVLLGPLCPELVLIDPYGQPRTQVSLTFDGLRRADPDAPELSRVHAVLASCVAAEREYQPERGDGDAITVSAADVRSILEAQGDAVSDAELDVVFAVFVSEWLTAGSSGQSGVKPPTWSFRIDRSVRDFAAVASIEGLVIATRRPRGRTDSAWSATGGPADLQMPQSAQAGSIVRAMDRGNGDPVPEIGTLRDQARVDAQRLTHSSGPLRAVAFFDLTGSTASTLSHGNEAAAKRSLEFTSLVDRISREFGGVLVKTLGDGAFVSFDDALAACRAALNLRYAALEGDMT